MTDQSSKSQPLSEKRGVPEGLWVKCKGCEVSLFAKALEKNHNVCPECDFHHLLTGRQRVEQLVDPETFEEFSSGLASIDRIGFVDSKPYSKKLSEAEKKTGEKEAVVTGIGYIKGRKAVLACMNFGFMGGSMASVVGEKITRAVEKAIEKNLPLVIVSSSGGARMQESGFSLMQMAKISAALAHFDETGGLYISVLTDPTTGGVTASFAMLGDIILAEPKALIGFAGPRVIKQTIRKELPEGFQRSEFLLDCGFIDRIVPRSELRSEIAFLIDFCKENDK